jgi:hypothetical protein
MNTRALQALNSDQIAAIEGADVAALRSAQWRR